MQRDTAAFLALYLLALRNSNPFDKGDANSYTNIRRHLCVHFNIIPNDACDWCGFFFEVLGPVLLIADTLQCYSRLLAAAAEQLEPAARAVQLHEQAQAVQAAPAAQSQEQRPLTASLHQLEMLLQEPLAIFGVLSLTPPHLHGTWTWTRAARSSSGAGASFLQPPSRPMRSLSAEVQSSWVLEHWARVLLLGTAPALAGGEGSRQLGALALHASYLPQLYDTCHALDLAWADVMRRPCCPDPHGPPVRGPGRRWRVRPATARRNRAAQAWGGGPTKHAAAADYDAAPVRRGQAASLHPAEHTLNAWMALLGEAFQEAPGQRLESKRQGAAATASAGCAAPHDPRRGAVEEREGGGRGAGQGRDLMAEGPRAGAAAAAAADAEGHSAGLATPDSVPPLNRSATTALCLRLGRGLLARWGGQLPGVQLYDLSAPGRANPLLPKATGSTLLYLALSCARLALLPDVQGRERLRGTARAQLRAWWEMFVAAAQHPEALIMAVTEPPLEAYPAWAQEEQGVSAQPSADAAAALAAGLLPCLTRQVTRMGTGDGGPVWVPPNIFPGTFSCCTELLLHGPLEQVGELVSAMGRRAGLSVEELRAATAEGAEGRRARRAGRSATWLALVAHDTLHFAHWVLNALCQGQAAGAYPEGVGLSDLCGKAPARARQGLEAAGGAAAAAAAGAAGGAAAAGAGAGACGQPELYAVRSSIAAAELLPPLSRGLQLCAELAGRGEVRGERRGRMGASGPAVVEPDALRELLHCAVCCAGPTLWCTGVLLAKHAHDVVRKQRQQQQDAGAAAAAGSGCHGASDGGGAVSDGGAVGGGGGDSPWRRLLLRDVQLMELLGAALKLHAQGAAAVAARVPGSRELQRQLEDLRRVLVRVLCQAVCTFPGEFRAAVDPGAGVAGRPEAGAGAAAARGGSGHGHGGPPPCMTVADIAALLEAVNNPDALTLVMSGLEGQEMPADTVWHMSECYLVSCRIPLEKVPETLRVLLPPAEARAAVAAAAAAAASAAAAAARA